MNLKPAFSTWFVAAWVTTFLVGVKSQPLAGGSLDPLLIPKYVEPLTIPPVLYDDNGGANPLDVEIAFRQFDQQVLPAPFPMTTLWGYGNPADPGTFSNPSFTIEVTKDVPSKIKWTNDLVDGNGYYLQHILQAANPDPNGPEKVPIVDQTLHWAAPNGGCKFPEKTQDCVGTDPNPYFGPIPMTVHVHGAHVGPGSDGYPESWWLPNARDIPAGYATEGTYYESETGCVAGQGCAVDEYTNDQPTSK